MEDWLGQSLVENCVQLHASIKHEKLIHIAVIKGQSCELPSCTALVVQHYSISIIN